MEYSHIFFKKVFPIFRERYIQNPSIFRTRSILRNLVYSEPTVYSEHCQTSLMERFAKVGHFLRPSSKKIKKYNKIK